MDDSELNQNATIAILPSQPIVPKENAGGSLHVEENRDEEKTAVVPFDRKKNEENSDNEESELAMTVYEQSEKNEAGPLFPTDQRIAAVENQQTEIQSEIQRISQGLQEVQDNVRELSVAINRNSQQQEDNMAELRNTLMQFMGGPPRGGNRRSVRSLQPPLGDLRGAPRRNPEEQRRDSRDQRCLIS